MRHGSEVGGERIRALRLLRRGLHASPELHQLQQALRANIRLFDEIGRASCRERV